MSSLRDSVEHQLILLRLMPLRLAGQHWSAESLMFFGSEALASLRIPGTLNTRQGGGQKVTLKNAQNERSIVRAKSGKLAPGV